MSALKALQKHQPRNNLIEEIQAMLDSSVSLHWVKAHIGIEGNESADKAAKEATTRNNVDLHLGLPIRSLKTNLKRRLLDHWQRTWEDRENSKGRFTYAIYPRVSTSRCTDNSHITQALTNHGRFPSYFRRFNIKESTCRCGEDVSDDALHYIYHCPSVTHLRNRISPSHSLPQIISDTRMAQELCRIIHFVNTHQDDILQLED
ncbi:hypothetical protein AVEN_168617-1 [Araneus ventricosus]|uniref:RNase H type-1 domain-containing protein n=1 Tax=Araneus ventricosus TaxID=182803 RepID=A0A4Y2SI25_ARAVE|nr:hypothetical protein AVEN_168617-1 [Araneus ventricosus]